jgi:hypothetical protein
MSHNTVSRVLQNEPGVKRRPLTRAQAWEAGQHAQGVEKVQRAERSPGRLRWTHPCVVDPTRNGFRCYTRSRFYVQLECEADGDDSRIYTCVVHLGRVVAAVTERVKPAAELTSVVVVRLPMSSGTP